MRVTALLSQYLAVARNRGAAFTVDSQHLEPAMSLSHETFSGDIKPHRWKCSVLAWVGQTSGPLIGSFGASPLMVASVAFYCFGGRCPPIWKIGS